MRPAPRTAAPCTLSITKTRGLTLLAYLIEFHMQSLIECPTLSVMVPYVMELKAEHGGLDSTISAGNGCQCSGSTACDSQLSPRIRRLASHWRSPKPFLSSRRPTSSRPACVAPTSKPQAYVCTPRYLIVIEASLPLRWRAAQRTLGGHTPPSLSQA